jgi:hypothetical protein
MCEVTALSGLWFKKEDPVASTPGKQASKQPLLMDEAKGNAMVVNHDVRQVSQRASRSGSRDILAMLQGPADPV